ncbi:MAG: glutaminyl-peptide cyclotransferase [Bacteroidia bacterium]|nr:glutaminyl-peptide cyclotransferase [Bacteroidia bacterium]
MKRIANILFGSLLVPLLLLQPLCTSCQAKIKQYKIKVVNEYPHDRHAYTQGLFFYGGELYETTGQYGESTLRRLDLTTGEVKEKLNFSRKYFAEGSAELDGKIYILTWESKVAFVYDAATLTYEKTYSYPREGWGITTDGTSLITSDGSSRLYFLDKDFKLQRSVMVRLDGRPVHYLNELEYIDGKIWANMYLSDLIFIINPENGEIEAAIDCADLLDKALREEATDVLNGIAYNPQTRKIYLTGKNWPRLYEVKLVAK